MDTSIAAKRKERRDLAVTLATLMGIEFEYGEFTYISYIRMYPDYKREPSCPYPYARWSREPNRGYYNVYKDGGRTQFSDNYLFHLRTFSNVGQCAEAYMDWKHPGWEHELKEG